jgi:hypothetical protein
MDPPLDIHDFANNLRFRTICARNPATNQRHALDHLANNPETNIRFAQRDIIKPKDYNVYVDGQHLIVDIPLPLRHTMISQIVPSICADGMVAEIVRSNMQLILDDHVFDNLADHVVDHVVPVARYKRDNAIIRLYYLANDPHHHIFANPRAYIVLDYIAWVLQPAYSNQLIGAESCVYMGKTIRSDDSMRIEGNRVQIINGNVLRIRERTCDIKSIVFETIDLATHEVVANATHSVELMVVGDTRGILSTS